MSARTGLPETLDVLVGKLTLLFTDAVNLLKEKKRDPDQIRHLMRALQLFRENKLVGAVSRNDPAPSTLEEFRAMLRDFDQRIVTDRVYSTFSTRVRNAVGYMSLPQLLVVKRSEMAKLRLIGKFALSSLEMDLERFGLRLGMTPEEIQAKLPELREETIELLRQGKLYPEW